MGNKFINLVLSEAIPVAAAAASRTAASQAAKYSNQSSTYKKVSTVVKSNAADASKDWLKSKAQPPAKSNDTKYTPNKPAASKPAPKTGSGNPPPDTTPAKNDDDSGSNSTSDNAERSRFSNLAQKAREAKAKTQQAAKNKIRDAVKDTATGTKSLSQGLVKGAIRQLGSSSVNN